MIKTKNYYLIAFLALAPFQLKAGFFDNLVSDLQNSDLGGLLTDVVNDVASGIEKKDNVGKEETKEEDNSTESFINSDGLMEVRDSELTRKCILPFALTISSSLKYKEKDSTETTVTESVNFCSPRSQSTFLYKDEVFNGVSVVYDGDSLEKRMYWKDGMQYSREYFYPSGQMKRQEDVSWTGQPNEYLADNFVKNGTLKRWYENGQMSYKGEGANFFCDSNGRVQEWYENGNKKLDGFRVVVFTDRGSKKCKPAGLNKKYFESGALGSVNTYDGHGVANGLTQTWFENGNLFLEGQMSNGIRDGLFKQWKENGDKDFLITFDGTLKNARLWVNDYEGELIESPIEEEDLYFPLKSIETATDWDKGIYFKKSLFGFIDLTRKSKESAYRIGDPSKLKNFSVEAIGWKRPGIFHYSYTKQLAKFAKKEFIKVMAPIKTYEGKIFYRDPEIIYSFDGHKSIANLHKREHPKLKSLSHLLDIIEKFNYKETDKNRAVLEDYVKSFPEFISELVSSNTVDKKHAPYKPFQKEISISDLDFKDNLSKLRSGQYYSPTLEDFVADPIQVKPKKRIYIYAHDYKKYKPVNSKKDFELKKLGYAEEDYKIIITSLKFDLKKDGLVEVTGYNLGAPMFVATIKDDKFHGSYKEYYLSRSDVDKFGKELVFPALKNANYKSIFKFKRLSTHLAKTVDYKNGKKHGVYKQFSRPVSREDGLNKENSLLLIDRFNNNMLVASQKLVAYQNYNNGKLDGEFLYAYPTSMRPSLSGQYKKGKKDGVWKRYYYDNLIPEMPNIVEVYKNGRLSERHKEAHVDDLKVDESGVTKFKHNGKIFTGAAFEYDDKDNRVRATFYSKGYKNGTDVEFSDNGYPKALDTYKKGVLSGPSRRWDEKGYVVYEADYKKGKINGNANSYYSYKEMVAAGHITSDVAWSTRGTSFKADKYIGDAKMASDLFIRRGTDSLPDSKVDNKYTDYVVSIYRNGVLYTDMSYSTAVMSHPAVGFTRRLPLKSSTTMKKGISSGLETTYYPNGHKFSEGKNVGGKRTGDWNYYHAWRPNSDRDGNILLKTSNYKKGKVQSDRVYFTNEELNNYGGTQYESSYKLDMEYVTGGTQKGVCFDCYKTNESPQFKEGFELRRSVKHGILPKNIATVAKHQTTQKVNYKDTKNLTEGGGLFTPFTVSRTKTYKDGVGASKPSELRKYSSDYVSGGRDFYGDLNTGAVVFSKFSVYGPRPLNISSDYPFYEGKHNYIGMDLERKIANESKDLMKAKPLDLSFDIGKVLKLRDRSKKRSTSKELKESKPVDGKLCVYEDFESTREFNRRLVDLTLVPIPMNASILGQSMSKANEQSFDMYSGEYIDFLKSLRIRKSEKWNTKIRKPRNELKFDKGFFSSSWLDKETGEPFSGWGEQNHENGNIKKEWFFDEGVMLYQAFYFPNGQLKDEQYLSGTKRHGPALGYYKNGTQRFVAYFVNGEKWLPTINYYENGNIKGDFLYWNGKEAGYANSFHENGALHDQTLFGKSPDPEYISLSSNKPKRKVRDDGGEVIGRVFCKDNGLKHVEEDWSRMDDHRGFTGKLMVRTALRMYDKNGALEYDTAGLEMKTRKRKSSFKKGYIWVKVPKDDKVGYENVKKRTSVKKEALKDKSAINLEDFIQENHDPLKLRIKLSNLQKGPDGSCIICNAEDRKTYYKGKRFTGTWFHSKKGMFFEREVVEGITDGRDEAWNSKGVQRKIQFYKAGRAHGLARTWDDSGKIIESKYFIKGKEVNEKDWNRHQKNQ